MSTRKCLTYFGRVSYESRCTSKGDLFASICHVILTVPNRSPRCLSVNKAELCNSSKIDGTWSCYFGNIFIVKYSLVMPGDNYSIFAVIPAEEQQELEWFRLRDYSSKEKYLRLGACRGQPLVGVEV